MKFLTFLKFYRSPNENAGGGTGQVPTDQGQVPNNNGGSQAGTLTLEEALKQLAETRKEAGKYRTERNQFETELKKRTDAELSEAEKLKKQAEEATGKLTARETELRLERTERAIERAASKLGIVDPETALALIGGKVEYGDDGKPTNIEALLTDLVKAKPFLLASGAAPATGAGAPGRQRGQLTRADIANMTRVQIDANYDEVMKVLASGA